MDLSKPVHYTEDVGDKFNRYWNLDINPKPELKIDDAPRIHLFPIHLYVRGTPSDRGQSLAVTRFVSAVKGRSMPLHHRNFVSRTILKYRSLDVRDQLECDAWIAYSKRLGQMFDNNGYILQAMTESEKAKVREERLKYLEKRTTLKEREQLREKVEISDKRGVHVRDVKFSYIFWTHTLEDASKWYMEDINSGRYDD